jgi:DNA-binding transcriptional LysR family regulator
LVVVASPTFPRPARDEAVPAVVRTATDARTWNTKTPEGRETVATEPVLAFSSLIMARDAARTVLRAARLPISLVIHELAEGRLAHWGDIDAPEITLWTLYPSRRLLSAREPAFLEHLREVFPTGRGGGVSGGCWEVK